MRLNDLFNRAKRAAGQNPDAVRSGLDKVEGVVNRRTGDRYSDKLAKGRAGLDKALGVPDETNRPDEGTPRNADSADNAGRSGNAGGAGHEGEQRNAGNAGNAGTERPESVGTDPIDPPTPVDRPEQVRRSED